MQSIYIPHLLKFPGQCEEIAVNDFLPDLETLTPIRGNLRVKHCQTFLEVTAKAEAIATLVCDRCLQHYNRRLQVDAKELIWLEESREEFFQDRAIGDDFAEVLSPRGTFEPEVWLYEQFSLTMPLQKNCGEDCPGSPQVQGTEEPAIDRRWAGLEVLKQKLK